MNDGKDNGLKLIDLILNEAEKGINQHDRTIAQSTMAFEQQEILLEEKNGTLSDAVINDIMINMMPLPMVANISPLWISLLGTVLIDGFSKKAKKKKQEQMRQEYYEKQKQIMQEYYVKVTKCQRKVNGLAAIENEKERKDYLHSMDIYLTALQKIMIQNDWV